MPTARLMEAQDFNEGIGERMAQTFGDLDSIKILQAISSNPRTAQDISSDTGIPLSSVYRKLSALEGAGLAYLKSSEFNGGKKRDLFASAVNEIRLVFAAERIQLDLVPTDEYAERARLRIFAHSSSRISGTWSTAANTATPSD
jgi:DNA-binding transcriptional ArsR family regulator